jgi:hypothetical protein
VGGNLLEAHGLLLQHRMKNNIYEIILILR